MADKQSIKNFMEKIESVKQNQKELNDAILSVEKGLSESLVDMDKVVSSLEKIVERPCEVKVEGNIKPDEKEEVSVIPEFEEFDKHMGKILQGSLDAMENKISSNLMNMMKELKGMPSGSTREGKMKEVREVVKTEQVDLSGLYGYEAIESNIDDVGVKEEEVEGIDKSLEILKQLKKG